MNFPHLDDTNFPILETENAYQFKNTFDYTSWDENTTVKICSVLWDSEYTNVVKWDDNDARDAYIESLVVYTVTLQSRARILPDGKIKLPLPFDVVARSNYVYVEFPIAPIGLEHPDGIRKWFFFIVDYEYAAPNTTTVVLQLDIWSTFQNDVELQYMFLERGHAPMNEITPETFLTNPLENNTLLLTPDVNFGNATQNKSQKFIPFGNGEKWVLIASTCPRTGIASLGTVSQSSAYNGEAVPNYSDKQDENSRWNSELAVSTNNWGVGLGYDYTNLRTPYKPSSDGNVIANGYTVYALPAIEVFGSPTQAHPEWGMFYQDVARLQPTFLQTIKAVFVVAEETVTIHNDISQDPTYIVGGHTLYFCGGASGTLGNIQLQKSDFSIPQKYNKIAKLYTYPYSELEVTDNDGKTVSLKVEELSNSVKAKFVSSVAYPFLRYRVFLEGINGVASTSYEWKDLLNYYSLREIEASDWLKFCFDSDIPTYELYMDANTAYSTTHAYRGMKYPKEQLITDYQNKIRSANNDKQNSKDSNNVAETNANNSSDTAETNAYNNAMVIRANADNNAELTLANAKNDSAVSAAALYDSTTVSHNNASLAQTEQLYITEETVKVNDYATSYENWLATNKVGQTSDMNSLNVIASSASAVIQQENTNNANFAMGIASGAVSGGTSGAMAGGLIGGVVGTVAGGVVGGASASIQAMTASENVNTALNTEANIVSATNAINSVARKDRWYTNVQKQIMLDNLNIGIAGENSNVVSHQMALNETYADVNAAVIKDLADANASNTGNVLNTNAENTASTIEHNATNTRNTTDTNAENTKNVGNNNADKSNDVTHLNAKQTLATAKDGYNAVLYDTRQSPPEKITQYSGNPTPDAMRTRGIQIKIKTQNKSALTMAGDYFLRFGYALNQEWDISSSGLNIMKYFTYWKCSDIWVDDIYASSAEVQNTIANIFKTGVTVWSDPTKIGKVKIDENWNS